MRNVLQKAYGIGAPIMGSFVGPEMMGSDGRIYGTSSNSLSPPAGVMLLREATKAELDWWRYQSGKGGSPTPFDVRAEVAAKDAEIKRFNAGPKPNMGTTSNEMPNDNETVAKSGMVVGAVALVILLLMVSTHKK